MTTEPRQEARDIVRNVGTLDWQSGAAWGHYCERVVDALAAAIERQDAEREYWAAWPQGSLERLQAAGQAANEALSALREDD